MEVYVLQGGIEYEGDYLLGVYYSYSDAVFHREEYIRTHPDTSGFDYYNIERRVIGARAIDSFDMDMEAA